MKRSLIIFLVVTMLPLTLHAERADESKKIGRARITYYWIADENDFPSSTQVAIRDAHGKEIARTSRKFRKSLLMEGTGLLRDGRTVTYVRRVHGEPRFRVAHHAYGAGIGSCPLVPYRTIAVDPHFVKLGTRVFIPELEGTRLPDGTVHDGMFMAEDRSPRIRGTHIDIFTMAGPRAAKPFIRRGYRTGAHVTLYEAERPDPHGCQTR